MATPNSKKPPKQNPEFQPDNLSRQQQSEGTPRPFSNEAGREETRNISPPREYMSEQEDLQDDESEE